MSQSETRLLKAAKRALLVLGVKSGSINRPPNWSMYEDIFAGRELAAAIEAVEKDDDEQRTKNGAEALNFQTQL